MAFRATLELGGKEYDVLDADYALSRDTDPKGRPSSGVYGGRITFLIESTEDTTIMEMMVNSQFKPFEGVVIFKKTDEDAKMKELTFKNAYIVYYKEALDVAGDIPMTIEFTVSAEELTLGNAEHLNRWPVA